MKKRCDWVTKDQIYIDYHDNEWGVPIYDDRLLFEPPFETQSPSKSSIWWE